MKTNERRIMQAAAELLMTATFFSPEVQLKRSITVDQIFDLLGRTAHDQLITDGAFIADEI